MLAFACFELSDRLLSQFDAPWAALQRRLGGFRVDIATQGTQRHSAGDGPQPNLRSPIGGVVHESRAGEKTFTA